MLTHAAHRREHPTARRRAHAPAALPGAQVLDGSARLVDAATGKLIAVQATGREALATAVAHHLRHIRYSDTFSSNSQARLSGLCSPARTFGYLPPVPLRKRYDCRRCALESEYPTLGAVLWEASRAMTASFAVAAPEQYTDTVARVDAKGVPPAWRLPGTPFTSGIVNGNSGLPYHRDAGNVVGSWSVMLAAKRHCEGGLLHLADYNTVFTVPHGSLLMFDGQSVLHGVTPFRLTKSGGYRYTVVLYARTGMARCAPDPADEPLRAAREATRLQDENAASRREAHL